MIWSAKTVLPWDNIHYEIGHCDSARGVFVKNAALFVDELISLCSVHNWPDKSKNIISAGRFWFKAL